MIKEDQIRYSSCRLSYHLQFFAEGPDKTEEPTAKKLTDARNEGQVAKSTELITASSLASMFVILKIFTDSVYEKIINVFYKIYNNLDLYVKEEFSVALISKLLSDVLVDIILICLPVFLLCGLVTFVSVLFQVKWIVSFKPLKPKFSKLNPISGFKKIFSKDKLMQVILEIIKIIIICIIAYNTLKDEWQLLFQLYDIPLEQAIRLIGDLVIDLGLKISMIFLIIGFADLIYQRMKFKKDMKMSKQEVKDEYKNSEGDPQVKGKIKQRMREASNRRMMQNLPTADVVITNPTHFAAAIKYDKESNSAPILIAKGADHLAEKIKEVAKENNIQIVENKPLARMLYYNVEIETEIPPELYQMTAEVLAYVYGLKNNAV